MQLNVLLLYIFFNLKLNCYFVLFFIFSLDCVFFFFFFFQAEDGIRDYKVTGVQTCALPISRKTSKYAAPVEVSFDLGVRDNRLAFHSGYLQSHFGRSFWNWTAGSPGQLPQASIQVDGIVLRFAAGEYFSLVGFTGHDNPPNVSPEKLADIRELGEYLGNAPVGLI